MLSPQNIFFFKLGGGTQVKILGIAFYNYQILSRTYAMSVSIRNYAKTVLLLQMHGIRNKRNLKTAWTANGVGR